MEYPVDNKNFINIALLIRKWCYTDQPLSVGDIVEFTNKDMGGHCKVKVTGVKDGKMEWTVENLYYINPSFQSEFLVAVPGVRGEATTSPWAPKVAPSLEKNSFNPLHHTTIR